MPDTTTVADRTSARLLLVISASASSTSRSEKLGDLAAEILVRDNMRVEHIRLRTLPPDALLRANLDDQDIARALDLLDQAEGVIIVTPTYKATYSGLLKVFVDLLSQYALRGKVVLPLATGGSVAHMLMLDYSLRPILQTMWPKHIAQGCFVADSHLKLSQTGQIDLETSTLALLRETLAAFEAQLG